MLIQYSKEDTDKEKISQLIRKSAPNSGHPMGYFMAKTILDYKSKDYLIKDLGNPFEYFFRYQEAAKANGKPTFSEASMNVLKDLENKYSISTN